jgi:hypothetical protein
MQNEFNQISFLGVPTNSKGLKNIMEIIAKSWLVCMVLGLVDNKPKTLTNIYDLIIISRRNMYQVGGTLPKVCNLHEEWFLVQHKYEEMMHGLTKL